MKKISILLWFFLIAIFLVWLVMCFITKHPFIIWGGVALIIALAFWTWLIDSAKKEFE